MPRTLDHARDHHLVPLIKARETTFCGKIGLVIRSIVTVEIGRRVDGFAESVISHESEVMTETLFDLQETTARIRSMTSHLKGLKIAIMGCIVNGPGEMADADFGYVGSGPGKITLYKGKEVMKRGVNSETAVDELIGLLKENNEWIERPE